MESFPAFYPLKGRRVIIAGDGEGADAKARLFAESPAEVVRLRNEAALDPACYSGADLIFVASYDRAWAEAAAGAARTVGAPLNVVDRPELSDFHTPAIVDRGQVVAAIGSAGAAPLLASLLRAEVELRVRPAAGTVAALLGERREALRAAFPDLPARRAFLRAILAGDVAQAAEAGDTVQAGSRLDAAIAAGFPALGQVTLIEIPSAPDLLSVRAVRALNIADIVVSTPIAGPLIESHARRDAEHWDLSDAAPDRLSEHARAGRLVCVLGCLDPTTLAAGLKAAGVSVQNLAPAPER